MLNPVHNIVGTAIQARWRSVSSDIGKVNAWEGVNLQATTACVSDISRTSAIVHLYAFISLPLDFIQLMSID